MNQDVKQLERIIIFIEHLRNDYEGKEFNSSCQNIKQSLRHIVSAIIEGDKEDG